MRTLAELIILIRGAGEEGSAIAHRLYRSHFRVCLTELSSPSALKRGVSFSEAVYENTKSIEGVTAELTPPTLESIYKVWRNGKIPLAIDPDLTVKPILKPDIIINAMMLKRETNARISDAQLVIGIGPGFIAGESVHLLIESNQGNNLGKVIIEGPCEKESSTISDLTHERFVFAGESGLFSTGKNIGDAVQSNDIIGKLDDAPVTAPMTGTICGILRNESKVLANARLLEIDPLNDKSVCFQISSAARAISGGVLEAIMMSLNLHE